MILIAAVLLAQLLDLVTWAAMPRAAEGNPLVAQLHDPAAVLAKAFLVLLVIAVQMPLRPKYRAVGDLVAVLAIMAGCIGAGANLSVLVGAGTAAAVLSLVRT